MMRIYHVYRRDKFWILKKAPGSKASYVYSTQREAIKRGKSLAQKNKCLLVVHYTDMSINKSVNYTEEEKENE